MPIAMFVAGIWTAVLACRASLRTSSGLPPLQMNPSTGHLSSPPPYWRFQFSLLTLVLLTAFVYIPSTKIPNAVEEMRCRTNL